MTPNRPEHEHRVLVLAPVGKDAVLTARILAGAGVTADICSSLEETCRKIAEDAAALVATEEAIPKGRIELLIEVLERQQAWSDFPIMLLARPGGHVRRELSWGYEALGNVSLLERPVRPETLVSAVKVATRGRALQYEVRDLMGRLAAGIHERDDAYAALAQRESRQVFLTRAATALASSLDCAHTVQRVLDGTLGAFATIAQVDLEGGGAGLVDVMVAHAEERVAAALVDMRRRYPPRPGHPAHDAYGKGVSCLFRAVTPDDLARAAYDDVHAELLSALGIRSAVVVPLTSRGRNTGVLTLASATTEYTDDDLGFAQDLARLMATSIDNELLFAASQKQMLIVEQANHAKDEFLAMVSHELRTPLNAMLGWTRMLRVGALAEERRDKALDIIERNAKAQAQLIEDLLDISRIITGKMRLSVGEVDLALVVDAALDAVRPAADAKGIALHAVIGSPTDGVMGDADRLQQVVWNLLSNSVKFTPRGGHVYVRVSRVDSSVEISVEDTGLGIPPEFLPYVFERFRQAEGGTTRNHGGLGLGLAIVRHLVELHGGTIEATSEGAGRGAAFRVRVPVAPVRAHAAMPASAVASLSPLTSESFVCPKGLEGLRVLVVDDEADARDLLVAVLSHCHVDVSAATSAEDALRELREKRPDVLISDIGMPGEDGYELIRRVRALPAREGGRTPAVALTAYARVEDRTKALLSGFNSHVAKPIEPAELVAVLATMRDYVGSPQA